MRRLLLIALLVALPATIGAQNATDRDAVLKVIQRFFDAMTARDVEGLQQIFAPEARFHAMETRKPDTPPISFAVSEEYFSRLRQSKQTYRERIWNPEVRVRGPIATVWAPYDFWADGTYSHCGIDAFDLIKTTDGWKISGGVFTMEAKCEPSPLGPLKQ